MPWSLRSDLTLKSFLTNRKLWLGLFIFELVVLAALPVTRELFSYIVNNGFSHQYYKEILFAPFLLAFGVLFERRMAGLNQPWLEWAPFHSKTNLLYDPLKSRLWPLYVALLAFSMPVMAFIEEWIFRYGTHNWIRGFLWGSLAFGLVHIFSMIPVRSVIYCCIMGAIFVEIYMLHGFGAVFVLHTVYNFMALTFVIIEVKWKQRNEAIGD